MTIQMRFGQLQKAMGYEHASDFARRVGIEPGTLRQQLARGSIPYEQARRYIEAARATGATLEWLLHGEGDAPTVLPFGSVDRNMMAKASFDSRSESRPSGDAVRHADRTGFSGRLDVFGATDIGGGLASLSEKPTFIEPRPHFAEMVPDAFGVFVAADNMEPAYRRGDRLLIFPGKPVIPGDDVLLLTAQPGSIDTRYALRRLMDITSDHWVAKQWSPEKVTRFARSEWPIAYRVESKRNR